MKFLKILTLFFLFLGNCIITHADDKFVVSGIIKDQDLSPVEGAVIILKDTEGNLLGYASSSSSGKFEIPISNNVDICIEVCHPAFCQYSSVLMGFNDIEIILKEIVNEIDAAIVEADKTEYQLRDGALVVNIGNNDSFQNKSLQKILSLMPGVSVDNSGGITLNGSTTNVYIDGVKQVMSSQSLKNLLETYPSTVIDEVELKSISGGEFSANGGAIINIITKKKIQDGLYLSTAGNGVIYDSQSIDGQGNILAIVTKNHFNGNASFTYRNDYTERTLIEDSYLSSSKYLSQIISVR